MTTLRGQSENVLKPLIRKETEVEKATVERVEENAKKSVGMACVARRGA